MEIEKQANKQTNRFSKIFVCLFRVNRLSAELLWRNKWSYWFDGDGGGGGGVVTVSLSRSISQHRTAITDQTTKRPKWADHKNPLSFVCWIGERNFFQQQKSFNLQPTADVLVFEPKINNYNQFVCRFFVLFRFGCLGCHYHNRHSLTTVGDGGFGPSSLC